MSSSFPPYEGTIPNLFSIKRYSEPHLEGSSLHQPSCIRLNALFPKEKLSSEEKSEAAALSCLSSFHLRESAPLNASKKEEEIEPTFSSLSPDAPLSSFKDPGRFFFYKPENGPSERRPIKQFASRAEKDLWELRKEEDPKEIERKLTKELDDAKKQMERELDKPFVYKAGSRGKVEQITFKGFEGNPISSLEIGVCSDRGRRHKMEDAHLISSFVCTLSNKTSYPAHLLALFDGHGGDRAALYAKKHLQSGLEKTLLEGDPEQLSNQQIWNGLKTALVATSHNFPGFEGTTALIALIINDQLWIANVGDSRAVFNHQGVPIQLSEDAKPTERKYQNSIEKRGGKVYLGRLQNANPFPSLSTARALGDPELEPGITARSKNTMIPLSTIEPGDDLILACDGIFDIASTRQIVDAAHSHPEESASNLAQNIVSSAYASGSRDNLSTIVVKFKK